MQRAGLIYTIPFADCRVGIKCHGLVAEKIVNFLFPQAIEGKMRGSEPVFMLKSVSQDDCKQYLLCKEGQEISRSYETGVMATMVLDAVVSWFAGECRMGPTLHAAALMIDDKLGVLLPGKSGSGKSTLSAWMARYGYGYLTDELACLPKNTQHTFLGFPRPIHLKRPTADFFGELLGNDNKTVDTDSNEGVLKSNQGLLVSVGQLNPNRSKEIPLKPLVAAIVFPTFKRGSVCQIEPISSAKSFTLMMGAVVNARNFEDHAVKEIAQLVRDVPSFALTFDRLEVVIPTMEPIMRKILNR